MKRIFAAAIAAATLGVLALSSSATAATTIVYNNIPDVLPGNVPSLAYQANQTYAAGDHISFPASPVVRELKTAEVLLSSWACETGGGATCVTTPGATFSHPITLTLYAVNDTTNPPTPGAVLYTVTQSFDIPFRPSADPTCPGGTAWRLDASTCFNGLANLITFDLESAGIELPSELIYSIGYNTQTYGPSPIGVAGPYDSLNVGLTQTAPTVGTDENGFDGVYTASTNLARYGSDACSGANTINVYRFSCYWATYAPMVRFTAVDDSDLTPPEFSIRAKVGGGNVINENLPDYVIDTWATKNVAVYLRCTDPEPDVSGISVFRGDKAVTFKDGIHYYSTGPNDECIDNGGNEAAAIGPIGPIKVDTKAPVCSVSPSTIYIKRGDTGVAAFNLTYSDATSGVVTPIAAPVIAVSGGAVLNSTSGPDSTTFDVTMGTSTAGRVEATWTITDEAGLSTACKAIIRAK